MYAKIVIEYKVKSLDKVFFYHIPNHLQGSIQVGMKVLVPFGYQEVIGFVLEIVDTILETDFEIKDIIDIVDIELVLNKELLDLGKYISDNTMCTLISAYQTMLPSSLKIKKQKRSYAIYDEYISLVDRDKAIAYKNKYYLRKGQIKVIDILLEKDKVLKKEISKSILNSLVTEGIVNIERIQKYRLNKDSTKKEVILTDEQDKVYKRVIDSLNEYKVFLLHGVTGSGKTEVYIKLIEEVIKKNKTAIMLVPEISLTTQIAKRFYQAFGDDVAILHSQLSEGERYDEYLKIYRGLVHVVVGTRSAIFAPFNNLGIIIIDEEDSNSYKQENNPRYHARDIAKYRAEYNNIPLLLGSATPSLESKARADKGVYTLLNLKNRVGSSILPKIHIVNMEEEVKKHNMIFSDLLTELIKDRLDKKEQIILLLNRRGFSTYITCSNCSFTYKCPNCDITLTYHKSNNNLICHYCGYQKKKEDVCPKCGEDALNYYGLGTEKLEEKINILFPQARVIRMDQDTTRNKGMHEKIIQDFADLKYDILLGTQMISKGLDFPSVSLVGVINADASLNIPDYRSSENTFALLSQVSGRSGRRDKLGSVVIQTMNPDNYVIKCVQENNYNKFYLREMQFRHKLKYPPYYYLVSLKVIGTEYTKAILESKKVKEYLTNNLDKDIIVLGPTTAQIFKYNGEYRMQIIIKYQQEKNLKKVLKDIDNIFVSNKDARLEIDFNPIRI